MNQRPHMQLLYSDASADHTVLPSFFDHRPLRYELAIWIRYQTPAPTRAANTRLMQPNTISDFALPGPIRKAVVSWKTAGSRNANQEMVISFSVLKLHHTAEHEIASST